MWEGSAVCALDQLDALHPGGPVGLQHGVNLGGGLRSDVRREVGPELRADCACMPQAHQCHFLALVANTGLDMH